MKDHPTTYVSTLNFYQLQEYHKHNNPNASQLSPCVLKIFDQQYLLRFTDATIRFSIIFNFRNI